METPVQNIAGDEEPLPPSEPAPPRALIAALCTLALAFFLFAQWQTWRQYLAGEVVGDAVHNFDMMLSRAAAGDGMTHLQTGNHYFHAHVRIHFYLLKIFYLFVDSIWTYLTFMNAALAAAVLPLGMLAWSKTRSAVLTFAVALFYCTHELTGTLRFSLHPESLAMPAWFLLFWAMERGRWGALAAAVAVLLSVKEDMAAWLTMVAVWALFFRRIPLRPGLALLGSALLGGVAFIIISKLVPQPNPSDVSGLFWMERYGSPEESPLGTALWFLKNPGILAERWLLNPTWLWLILGAGIVGLAGWRVLLLCIPPGLMIFAMESPIFQELHYYYSYIVYPYLLVALVEGLAVILKKTGPRGPALLAGWLLLLSIVYCFVPTRTNGWRQHATFATPGGPDRPLAGRFLVREHVDPDAEIIVAAHYHMAAWIPRGRQATFLTEEGIASADLIALDTVRISSDLGRARYMALLQQLSSPDSGWRLREELDGYVILERKPADGDQP